jgi:hypothetical protein
MGWHWTHLVLRPLFGQSYQSRMIDDGDCGAIGGMRIGGVNRSTQRKSAPMPLCPPQIAHDLTRTRARAVAVGSRRVTTWATARIIGILVLHVIVPPFEVFRPTVHSFPNSNNKTFPVPTWFIFTLFYFPAWCSFQMQFHQFWHPDFIGYSLINLLLNPNKCYIEMLSTELYRTVIIL